MIDTANNNNSMFISNNKNLHANLYNRYEYKINETHAVTMLQIRSA